jgi:hypothetical protein
MSNTILQYDEFVAMVISALNAAGVEYLIGGAVAVWQWGEPRTTLDLDLVVDIPIPAVNRLSDELSKRDMLVPSEVILDNILETRSDLPINAIHMFSGYKADLYPVRKWDELRISAFNRRQIVDMGLPLGKVYVHSPEDLILYKLWYYSLSQQTKHTRDISSILMALKGELDIEYINYWADKRGLSSLWQAISTKNWGKSSNQK